MVGLNRHKTETRIEAARLLDAGFGYSAVASQLGLSQYTVREWADAHRQGRLLGLRVMEARKLYPPEVKVAAVEKFLSGVSKSKVIEDFQITNRGMFNKWVVAYRDLGPAGLVEKRRGRRAHVDPYHGSETDEQKISRLEMEIEVLKKLIALAAEEEAALLSKRERFRR